MEWSFEPDSNGLYPAVPNPENPEMDAYWIRDNYFIYLATREECIAEAFAEIVRKHTDKIYSAINGNATEDYMHVHPRYDENLEEIDGGWGWLQWDSVGNMIEVLSREGFDWEATLLVNYLEAIEFWNIPDNGIWEEEKDFHPSSLGAVIRGYKEHEVSQEKIDRVERHMLYHLPRKDLATATLLYPEELVSGKIKEDILKNLETLTNPEFGTMRYLGDNWNGEEWTDSVEPYWTMGLGFLYLITGEQDYLDSMERIKDEHGELPESFVVGKDNYVPNTNSPLLWSEALYFIAENTS